MSYYPHNQPIVTSINQDDEEPSTVLQSATNTLLPTATIVDRSQARSPSPDHDHSQAQPMAMTGQHIPRLSAS